MHTCNSQVVINLTLRKTTCTQQSPCKLALLLIMSIMDLLLIHIISNRTVLA